MPSSRGSATLSDCGIGGGGGVSGQTADTHTSTRLLGVAKHWAKSGSGTSLASLRFARLRSSCGGDAPASFLLSCSRT